MFGIKVPGQWLWKVCVTGLLFFTSGCSDLKAPTPAISASEPAQIESSFTPIPSMTAMTISTAAPTKTPLPVQTQSPTLTPTTMATDGLVVENTATKAVKTYPEISPDELYTKPDEYNGKRFMFTGVLIAYGQLRIDGKTQFVLQVGIPGYPRPILVLNTQPNPNMGTNDGVIIGGTGMGVLIGLDPADPNLSTPVVNGEWFECNLPVDQQKFPPEFWTKISQSGG